MRDLPRTNITLRTTATQLGVTVHEPYRVGLGRDLDRLANRILVGRDWRGVRCTLKDMAASARRRSWWGLWQCEGSLGLRARRGWTARKAEERMLRDEIHAALTGRWTR
ncbi:hypothetical protein [Nonomuraea sp. NPDC049646]|uniref:hypothetical protein n=1 Tax=unclassified Nonomuraea TaxID=2593643 RepID=UPI0037987410